MSAQLPMPELARRLTDVVATVIDEIRPRLIAGALTGEYAENKNIRHSDNFLSSHDLWMHERYKELLAGHIPSFVYASEEADPQVIGDDPDPDLLALVDPLDTSELAVRALHGYTHLMIYSRSLARPVIAIVGDIYHHVRFYLAARDEAGEDHASIITADGTHHRLAARPAPDLAEALITNYLMRPAERFVPLSQQTRLIEALSQPSADGKTRGRIGVDFGSVSLCHVAAGFTDATIEFAKGFAIWDLAPGHYILEAMGGVVVDLNGQRLPLDYGLDTLPGIHHAMNRRQTFIATTEIGMAHRILKVLNTRSAGR